MDAKRIKLEEDMAWEMWKNKKTTELNEPYFLEADKVEKGIVLVQPMYESAEKKVSVLTLFPGAKIKEHLHKDDKEMYIIIESLKGSLCKRGEAHSLENPSTSEYMFVLSIKSM